MPPLRITLSAPVDVTLGKAYEPAPYKYTPYKASEPAANDHEPITIAAYQGLAEEALKAGFTQGSVVVYYTPNIQRYKAYRMENWGVVNAIYRYRPSHYTEFRPIEVTWLKNHNKTIHFPKELILLSDAPEWTEIIRRINAGWNSRSITEHPAC